MSSESSARITWQKMAVIVAVLALALPVLVKAAWEIVFPPNFLLYEIVSPVRADGFHVSSIAVTNAGNLQQKDVELFIFPDSPPGERSSISISAPRQAFLSSLFDDEPTVPLSRFTTDNGYRIPLSAIDPNEQVRVTFRIEEPEGRFLSLLFLKTPRVQSSTVTAIKADGIRRPRHEGGAHTFYFEASPYFLAFMLAALALVLLIAFIHDIFFDTPRKQMSRLWRQMDELQERIDKERRYE